MNAMGHNVPNLIGVDHRGLAAKITRLIPDYMVMGERGMADMAEMEMPLPENTAPMMAGTGPYGSLEMGGMFSVLKVRREQKPGDYSDPGWWAERAPKGSVAKLYDGALPEAPQPKAPASGKPAGTEVTVRKPSAEHKH